MKGIGLLPCGPIAADVFDAVEMGLWHTFGTSITRLPEMPVPDTAFDAQRRQYASSVVLMQLKTRSSEGLLRLVALTEADLFLPMLTFVFGHAQLGGKLAVISLARLQQEFYGLPANKILFLSRAVKESIHEVGHTFGLTHCIDAACPMSLSNTVNQVDRKGEEFCRSCLQILHDSLKKSNE